MEIIDITLLRHFEFEKYRDFISDIDADWWLSTSDCNNEENAIYVSSNGEEIKTNKNNCLGIRPVLTIKNLHTLKQPGEKIKLFGYGENTWTIFRNFNYQTFVLYDGIIDKQKFDSGDKQWEKSELKTWLNDWLKARS